MKWLAVLLLVSASCFGQAFVQSHGDGQTNTSMTDAFTSNNTSGNAIAACEEENSTTDTTTVSDTRANTYTLILAVPNGTSGKKIYCWYAKNIASGANTVTFTGSQNIFRTAMIAEFSGIDTTAPLGGSNSNTVAATPMFSGSFGIVSGSMVVGFGVVDCGVTGQGSGYTLMTQAAGSVGMIYGVIASTTANPSLTQACANNAIMMGFELKAAGGGGGGGSSPTPTLMQLGVGQ